MKTSSTYCRVGDPRFVGPRGMVIIRKEPYVDEGMAAWRWECPCGHRESA